METDFENFKVADDNVTREKLVSDLKTVAHDAEELLKATAGDLGEKAKEARTRLTAAVEEAKATCHKLQDRASASAKATDKVIRDHPYESLLVSFGAGLLIGLLVNHK